MAVNQDTLSDRFLSPIIGSLIDLEKLLQFYETMDWEAECDRFRKHDLSSAH
ncbi:hypothetical protein [Moorena sp. SIOASIH]|uniref:hypothetical protein n=1 Tax=Moorena sp. SIOASIH TaxID=2607817 RepID=UPI0025E04F1E|nr:hypothetical protein [Moorena sp. SIOASIH]